MTTLNIHWDTPRPSKDPSCNKVTDLLGRSHTSSTRESDAECEVSGTGRRFIKDRRQRGYPVDKALESRSPPAEIARGSRSFPLENVHVSRPATPKAAQHKGKDGENPCIELDMSRMSNVIAEMEHTFAHVESTRLSLENRRCDTGNYLSQIPAFTRTLLKRLYCMRDVYRLGTEKVFLSEAQQDAFFENLFKVCNIVEANMSTDGALVSDLLGQILRNTLYDVIVNFKENLPDCIYDLIEKRANSALCPEPRYTVVKRGTTTAKAPTPNCIPSAQTGDPDANKFSTSAKEISGVFPPAACCETMVTQKIKWPLLNTTDLETLKKEEQLHSLMAEIDTLLEDVGLSDRRTDGLTYEVIMGTDGTQEPEGKRQEKRKIPRDRVAVTKPCDRFATTASRDQVAAIREGVRTQKSAANSRVIKARKPKDEQFTDKFSEELDKLLNDC
ncbi:uncharacterized protein LOC127832201 isoform X2 [Dreissena polymorpha]|uniref:Uncharacterized protein n=1 Tax=Dreissena polymorpha TaxID=45954 RepID=A0A9D4H787_DREPO|nr:uncharacterized protein LOC127832201 isoform X2 [Dreissena polymorpha]KAH3826577.1 hypothetical protein DPMN_128486 [Dreissena polymorpha]